MPVTMDEMLFLTRTVARARAPADRRRRHAVRLVPGLRRGRGAQRDPLRQGGAARTSSSSRAPAPMVSRVRAIVEAGIPVMGHIGLTPQSATMLGGFKTQGKTAEAARQLVADAHALEDAGCFVDRARGDPGAGRRADHRRARDPDDRDRRRRRLRRPGARLPRPARPDRGPPAALRQALREPRRARSATRSRRTRPRCAPAPSPARSTRTRCRRRSWPRSAAARAAPYARASAAAGTSAGTAAAAQRARATSSRSPA